MWTIIIAVFLTLFLYIRKIYKDYGFFEWDDLILLVPLIMLGSVIGGMIGLALPAQTKPVTTIYNLESLNDVSGIKGSFFLGSGVIEDEMRYVFYYEEDGFYKLNQVDYRDVKISYSDGNPMAEMIKLEYIEDSFINNFAFDYLGDRNYIIYVPNGSIKQGYTLDAQ